MSLQSWIVKKVIRRTAPRHSDFTVRRIKTDKMCGSYPLAKNITFEAIEIGGVTAEWSIPDLASNKKSIIYLHGGGYCSGSIISYRHFTSILAKETGVRTLCVEYRLAPEHPFPAALDDALSVYRSLLSEGIPSDNIVLAGDSAGGGLCVAVTHALKDNDEPLPSALVLFSPWTDLTLTADSIRTNAAKDPMVFMDDLVSMVNAYAQGQNVQNPFISPKFGCYKGFPPIFIHTGTDEVLSDDSIVIAEKAQAEGVDVTFKLWKNMFHIFSIFPRHTPEGKKSFREAVEYIRQRLGVS